MKHLKSFLSQFDLSTLECIVILDINCQTSSLIGGLTGMIFLVSQMKITPCPATDSICVQIVKAKAFSALHLYFHLLPHPGVPVPARHRSTGEQMMGSLGSTG